jgi:hypothetical protein
MIITWQEILIIIAIIIAVIVIFTTINVCLFKQSHCPFPLSLLPFWSEKECPEKTCPECPRIEEYEKWNFNTIEYSPGGNIFGDKKADSYLTSLTNGRSSKYYCDNDTDNKCRRLPQEVNIHSVGKVLWVPKCGNEYNHQFIEYGGRVYCSKVAPSKERVYVSLETPKDTDKLPLSYCCNIAEVYENGKMVTKITDKQNKPGQCPPFPCPQSTSRNVNDNDCCKLDVDEVYEDGKFVRKNRNINSSLEQCKDYKCSTNGTTSRDVNTTYDCKYGPPRLSSTFCKDIKSGRSLGSRTTLNYISDLINTNISVCPPTRRSQSFNSDGKTCASKTTTTPPPTTTTTTPTPTTPTPTTPTNQSTGATRSATDLWNFWERVRREQGI